MIDSHSLLDFIAMLCLNVQKLFEVLLYMTMPYWSPRHVTSGLILDCGVTQSAQYLSETQDYGDAVFLLACCLQLVRRYLRF